MKYQILGNTMPAVQIQFDVPGESMFTQSGGMAWMSDGISMTSNMKGGLGKSIGRMFSGESLFMATYTAQVPGAYIAFASTVAGEVLPVDVGACGGLICQKGAFLCAQAGVELNITFSKRFSAGLFGGEGFIMQRVSGQGTAFLEIDGHVKEYELAAGQSMLIDTGYLAAMEGSCTMDITTVKGLKNKFLGGEGFFNTVVTGPGRIWLQSMPVTQLAGAIRPYIPTGN